MKRPLYVHVFERVYSIRNCYYNFVCKVYDISALNNCILMKHTYAPHIYIYIN